MRPKKVILLVGDDENELSLLRFVLVTNDYRILTAKNPHEAINVFCCSLIDLVITYLEIPVMNSVRLAEKLKRLKSFVPIILLGNPAEISNVDHPADEVLGKTTSSAELLERVKIMSARKRGPRKKGQNEELPIPNELVAETV